MIKPGVYYDMPAKQYFAEEALSKSGMVDLNRSAHHYQTAKRIKKEPTKSMIFGSAMHLAILEPNRFEDMVFEHSKKTPKSNDEGQLFLYGETIAEIKTISENVRNHPVAGRLLEGSQKEVSLFWKDKDLDFMCKARADIINTNLNFMCDLKFCTDASYNTFARQTVNLKYHWQSYWYVRGYRELTGYTYPFLFICIEGAPTYSIAIYLATKQMMEKAEPGVDICRNIYASCMENDTWNGYPEEIQELYLPSWA